MTKNDDPGKYDFVCTHVREATEAEACAVIIFNGMLGSGFSVQSENQDLIDKLPKALEAMAKQMRMERLNDTGKIN
jgi:hypothetical protein